MNKTPNKYIAVTYKLYTKENGVSNLVEEATEDKPCTFISGFGITLESFENAIMGKDKGEDFDFSLTSEQAYGEHVEERVLDLDKSIFTINGHFDHDNIYKDAVVPLQNEDGNRFMGHVLSITDDKVKMDLNHPLAGKELNFIGHIIDSREATNDEIQSIINQMSGDGCGCSCDGGCGGDCDCQGDGECDHGHHHDGTCNHEHKGGCGHCH